MSFKAFVWAWEQDVPNGDFHHVLLCLANIAPTKKVRASIPYIAKQVRRSPRKVRAALVWLEESGLISREPVAGKPDQIVISVPAEFTVIMDDEDDADREKAPRGRRAQTPPKPVSNPYTPCADESSEPGEAMDVGLRAPEPFDVWWAAYPRKVAKLDARKAWRAVPAKIGLDDLLELTRRFADHVVGKDAEHIAHPATWLNGERWTDELPDRSQTDGQLARPARGADFAADRAAAQFQAVEQGARLAVAGGRRRWTL